VRTLLGYLLIIGGFLLVLAGFAITDHGLWAYNKAWETPGILIIITGMIIFPGRKSGQ
jgi:hypothetical protein